MLILNVLSLVYFGLMVSGVESLASQLHCSWWADHHGGRMWQRTAGSSLQPESRERARKGDRDGTARNVLLPSPRHLLVLTTQ